MIWKFPLGLHGLITIPCGSTILSAGLDPDGAICVWAEIGPNRNATEQVQIDVVGTGMAYDSTIKRRFINTVKDGLFMWHVFERLVT